MRAQASPVFDVGNGEAAPAAADILLGDHRFVADAAGALYWPAQDTLVAADLHLEKGSAFARRRSLLPPYDSRATLTALARAIDRHEPERVVALGDSFHDVDGAARLDDADLAILQRLQAGRDWIWVTGNHDPYLPARPGGRVADSLTIAGVRLRHEPSAVPDGPEIAGHLHPAARLRYRGATVRRKCFVGTSRRLVLPALGAYAGGLNVLDAAFAPLFGAQPFLVWMLGRARVYRLCKRQLLAE